jgi:hypothetical protein
VEHELNLGCSHNWAEDENTLMRDLNLYRSISKAMKMSNVEKQILNYFEISYDVSIESVNKWKKFP